MPFEGEYLFTKMLNKLKSMLKLKRFQAEGILESQDYQVGALWGNYCLPSQKSETNLVVTKHRRNEVLRGRKCSEDRETFQNTFKCKFTVPKDPHTRRTASLLNSDAGKL